VFVSVCADLKITPAGKTGSAERVTSACTGSNTPPRPRREMLMLGCVIAMYFGALLFLLGSFQCPLLFVMLS